MKKVASFILGMCIFCTLPAFCEEVAPQQTVENEKAYSVINIEKAPSSENKQMIKNTRSWFCINIVVNGKIKDVEEKIEK